MPHRAAQWAAAVAFLGALLACATGPGAPRAWDEPGVEIVWPEPPELARIAYVGAIQSPADLGHRPGLFQRLKDTIFGVRQAAMVRPTSVAVNEAGVLVVADPSVPTVHWFDLEGKKYRQVGEDLDEPMRSPVGVAIDATGWVYVADSVRARVLVFDPNLELVAEMGEDVLLRPTGLAFDRTGELLYVVDSVACRVVVFDRTGSRVGSFGRRGVGTGELNAPTHIAISPDGTVNVSDSLNFRVQRFSPDGTPLGSFGAPGDTAGHFGRPKGIAADSAGRLYVADAAFENIQIFEPDGTLLLPFGAPGTGHGSFTLPSGLFMDASDTIWVADSFNRRVQVFKLLASEP
jgi:DNA-binding beta-propeller fold protein YncE